MSDYLQSAHGEGFSSTSIAVQFPNNVAVGSIIVVFCDDQVGTSAMSVTDDGSNTYSPIGSGATGIVGKTLGFWAPVTGGAGTKITVTGTFNGTATCTVAIAELAGRDTTSPVDGFSYSQNTSSGTDAVSSGNFTPTTDLCCIVGFVRDNNGNSTSYASGTGFTDRMNYLYVGAIGADLETKILTPAGITAAIFTMSAGGSVNSVAGIAFKPASSASTVKQLAALGVGG